MATHSGNALPTIAFAAATLLAGTLAGDHLAPCGPEFGRAKAALAQELQEAAPQDRTYLPHPFPTRDDEVVADYIHQVTTAWREAPAGPPRPQQTHLLEELGADRVAITVARVANWGPQRCRNPMSGDDYALLLIRNRAGHELARAALHESGHVEQTGFPAGDEAPLLDLDTVRARLSAFLGVDTNRPTYVTSSGTLRCDVLMPCARAKTRDSTYIVTPKWDVFELSPDRRTLTDEGDMPTPDRKQKVFDELRENGEYVTSLGAGRFGVLRAVGTIAEHD